MLITQQQPLAMLTGNLWHGLSTQCTDETGFANTQYSVANPSLEPQARMAVDRFGGFWCLAEGAGDWMFRAVFQCGGQCEAAVGIQLA